METEIVYKDDNIIVKKFIFGNGVWITYSNDKVGNILKTEYEEPLFISRNNKLDSILNKKRKEKNEIRN